MIAGEGDAQKLFRKAYLTNALVCGRNPKRVASEVGHASLRMLTDQYEQWFDESNWPAPAAISRLAAIYGWDDCGALGRSEASGSSLGGRRLSESEVAE